MTRKSDISVISRLQRYARLLLPCILCAAVAAGCADRSDDTPSVPAAGFRAGFYITTAATNSPSLSRAPQPGTYEPGTADENYIDIDGKDFAIYFFDSSDAYVGSLTNVLITPADSDGRYKTYYVSGTVSDADVATLSGSLKVVILANWGDYPALASGDPMSRIAAHTPASMASMSTWRPGRDGYIPMYGVSNLITGVSFRDGWQTDLGTLHMLRALAQIRVREDVSTGGLRISSLRLTRANTAYMRAPAGVTAQDDYVKGNYAGDYYKTPSIPAAPAEVADVEMQRDADGTYRIYVPEYRNIASDAATRPLDSRARLAVVFETESVVRYVDFKYYDVPPAWAGAEQGDHFDILRNNVYDYTLTHIDDGTTLKIEVDVIPFTHIELKPDYGLNREDFTGYIIGVDSQGQQCWYDGAHGPYYLGPSNAPGAFVTINDDEYLLVYVDYDRTVAGLDHIYKKNPRTKYLLTPEGITGYEYGNDMYLNKFQQRVWLDSEFMLKCCGTLNEWDRLDWNKAYYWHWPDIYPKYWFDILGNRYPWSMGDTVEKRRAILGEWTKYLE